MMMGMQNMPSLRYRDFDVTKTRKVSRLSPPTASFLVLLRKLRCHFAIGYYTLVPGPHAFRPWMLHVPLPRP